MLLSEFHAKNNPSKAKPWMSHKHMRDGSIKFFESKQPIKRLTYQEISDFYKGLKIFLEKKSKHVILSSDEKRTLDELNKENKNDFEFEDKEFIDIVNKINLRISKFDGVENASLSGTISRELNDLVNSVYSQLNVPNILNKIAKDIKKPIFS